MDTMQNIPSIINAQMSMNAFLEEEYNSPIDVIKDYKMIDISVPWLYWKLKSRMEMGPAEATTVAKYLHITMKYLDFDQVKLGGYTYFIEKVAEAKRWLRGYYIEVIV